MSDRDINNYALKDPKLDYADFVFEDRKVRLPETMKRAGRFSWAVATQICLETAQGASIDEIFERHKGDPGWPDDATSHFLWMRGEPKYREMFLMAQEDRADMHVEKLLRLANEIREGKLGVNEARLISENLKWAAGKFNYKRYGEKRETAETTGKNIVFNFNLGNKPDTKVVEAVEVKEIGNVQDG